MPLRSSALLLAVTAGGIAAAEIDLSRLPPAATNVISFDQHVRPILDRLRELKTQLVEGLQRVDGSFDRMIGTLDSASGASARTTL